MAGALNNGSTNFKRMIGAGLTAALFTAVFQVYMNYNCALDFAGAVAWKHIHQEQWLKDSGQTQCTAFVLAFVPSIALGVIVPILAKVMSWYGLSARKQY